MTEPNYAEFYRKVNDIVGEHSTAFLVIAQVPDGEDGSVTLMSWEGGFNTALGLARRAGIRLEAEARNTDFPNSEPPDETEEWKRI